MKKVLLIGELNQTVSNLNAYLTDYYNTQICADNLELVKGMVKVFKPDLAIICLVGLNELDKRVLDYLQNEKSNIAVLLIGTADECRSYVEYYEGEQFDFIIRPTTQSALLEKCGKMLKIEEFEPEEEVVPVGKTEERKRRILIIDDSAMALRSIKGILEQSYEVVVANDGEKGLSVAKKKHPDSRHSCQVACYHRRTLSAVRKTASPSV